MRVNEQEAVAPNLMIAPESKAATVEISTAVRKSHSPGIRQQRPPLVQKRLAPRNADGWIWRAKTTKNQQEIFLYLCRALLLDPDHPEARQQMYAMLRAQLNTNPSLAYIDEEDHFYRVRTSGGQTIIVPKDRAVTPPYPAKQASPLANAYRWLGWAIVGLLLAGMGTLILAPVALFAALWADYRHPLNRQDQARVVVLVCATVVFWLFGLILTSLFLLHI